MNEYKEKLKELKGLMGYTDAGSLARKEELFHWFEANSKDAERQRQLDAFIREGIMEQRRGIDALRAEADPSYEIVPVAYIARKYFGKSRQWLYRRISGSTVRGRSCSLNDEQKATFNHAVQEVASRLSNVRLA